MSNEPAVSPSALALEVRQLASTAKQVAVADQESYDIAGAKMLELRTREKKIDSIFDPMREKAHKAWKEVCNTQNELKAPLADSYKFLANARLAFEEKQEQIRLKLEREAKAKQEEQMKELLLNSAVEAEGMGLGSEVVDAILESPVSAPVVARPTFTKTANIHTRTRWRAEVDSVWLLIQHVARNPADANLLLPNYTALDKLAQIRQANLRIPGVRPVADQSQVARLKNS